MAVITDLKPNASGERVKIYIDGDLYGTLSGDTVIRYGLRKNTEIDIDELNQITGESDKDLAVSYLLSYLTKFAATEKKAREMLKKKGYGSVAAENAIKKAKEYRYIDDRAFAEGYVERKLASSGVRKIKSELSMLGINSSLIAEVISEVDEDDILEGALGLSRRWWRTRDVFDRADRDKFVRYMSSKGFNWSVTERCIDEIKAEETKSKNEDDYAE